MSANDCLKAYLTVLQSASSHASHSNRDVPDLSREIAAAGLNTACRRGEGDSLHLLVMDLHKKINNVWTRSGAAVGGFRCEMGRCHGPRMSASLGQDRFFATVGEAVNSYVKAHSIQWVDWEDRR